MPQRRSIKNIIVESLVFLGLFASLGHMTVNFWEKFMIESELVHLKTSLHSLKETITHIGAAYDSLHKELRNLIIVAEKQYPARLKNVEYPTRPTLPPLPDPQAVKLKLDKTVKTDPCVAKHDKNTQEKTPTENKKLETLLNNKPLNAATLTRKPLKSVEVGDTNMHPVGNDRGDIYSVNEQQNENEKPKALVNTKPLDAATITRNPLKSVGVGDEQNENKKPKVLVNTEPLDAATITRNPLKSVRVGDQQNENAKPKALVNTKPLDAATKTRNPLKSAEENKNKNHKDYERRDIYSINEPHNCLYSPSYKYCRRRNQYNYPYDNWRV